MRLLLDWIGRVAVLVLSALATFAIIGSLVSVSAPADPEREGTGEIVAALTPEPGPTAVAPGPQAGARRSGRSGGAQLAAPAPHRDRELIRWLSALTYAVLGLAGFVAVLAIVAMRATAHLGAIADRR